MIERLRHWWALAMLRWDLWRARRDPPPDLSTASPGWEDFRRRLDFIHPSDAELGASPLAPPIVEHLAGCERCQERRESMR